MASKAVTVHVTEHLLLIKIYKVCLFYYAPCVQGCNADCHLIGVYWYDVNRGFREYIGAVKIWR